jgi:organic radical activating enzyme
MNVKVRYFPEKNYKAIFYNNKTIRINLNNKSIQELDYPEFYDIDIFETGNGLCNGNCPYCYLSGNSNGNYVKDAVEKIKIFFGKMTKNQRPFQVALPGSGELFLHPDWKNILKTFYELDIVPNYTTNGMFVDDVSLTKDVIKYTKKYVGGVAISCHKHLEKYWKKALDVYIVNNIKTNLHIIISDKKSTNYFLNLYSKYKNKIDYFVLLPYGNQGRAKNKSIDWEYLKNNLPQNYNKIAFGANFYNYLKETNLDVSIYKPEILSSFLSLWNNGTLYKSSFSLKSILKQDLFQ